MNIIIPFASEDNNFLKEFGVSKHLVKIGNKLCTDYLNQTVKNFPKKTCFYFLILKNNKILKDKIINTFKSNNIRIIEFNKETKSSLHTILKVKKFINNEQKFIVIHPDAFNALTKDIVKRIITNPYKFGVSGYETFNPIDEFSNDVARLNIKNNQVISIKEKSKLDSFNATVSGIYCFENFFYFEKFAIKEIKKNKPIIGNLFAEILKSNYKISYFKIKNYFNLGSIKALNEINFWYNYYINNKNYKNLIKFDFINIIPAAGFGSRHVREGFEIPKPFIKINKNYMINEAAKSLPKSKKYIYIFKKDLIDNFKNIISNIKKNNKNIKIFQIKNKTKGMAITCLRVKKLIDKSKPIIFSSCDYGFTFNQQKLKKLINEKDPDAIIFTSKKYPDARIDPNSYAYVKSNSDSKVTLISEKKTISKNPHNDFFVTGTFYFKNWKIFELAVKKMIDNKMSVNGEYYVATSITYILKKYKVYNFQINQFISWSLPIHLKTFYFWNKNKKFLL